MSLYSAFKQNQSLVEEGVWINYDFGGEEKVGFKLARMSKGNKEYVRLMEEVARKNKSSMRLNTLSNEQAESIQLDVFCLAVLKDWRGVTDENDESLAFTIENAKKLFTDLPDLYADLTEQAQNMANYSEATAEEVAKN
jgi:hypothetical protein